MKKIVYLDNHSSTPLDPRAFKGMLPYFTTKFGNASSATHALGLEAGDAVKEARASVARLIHADSMEIIFTSGATESNNLAIKGAAQAYQEKGNHIITVSTEHKSVLDSCKRLELNGWKVTYLPVKKDGLIDLTDLKQAITNKTVLLSVMIANNEIGVIQPIQKIGKIARAGNIIFHCDASQAIGKIPIDVKKLPVDLLSFTAHKIYGPKGVGALYIRKSNVPVKLVPLADGGGHEGGFRSGTLNVPGIVGFGIACDIARVTLNSESKRLKKLRDYLQNTLLSHFEGSFVNGSTASRLVNNLNICIPNVFSSDLIRAMKGVAISSGSACLSSSDEPSYVLKALGIGIESRRSSIRFGLGRFNTKKDIDHALSIFFKAAERLKHARL